MRVLGHFLCQKLKRAVGFDVAYLGEIGNHRNVCGQPLTKVLVVVFVEHAKRGFAWVFSSKNLSCLRAFPCPWPFCCIRLCAAWGKSLASQNDPGSSFSNLQRPVLMLGGRLPPSELPYLRGPDQTSHPRNAGRTSRIEEPEFE